MGKRTERSTLIARAKGAFERSIHWHSDEPELSYVSRGLLFVDKHTGGKVWLDDSGYSIVTATASDVANGVWGTRVKRAILNQQHLSRCSA